MLTFLASPTRRPATSRATSPRSRSWQAVLATAALAMAPAAVGAQRTIPADTIEVAGVVVDIQSGTAIPGALVSLPELGRTTVTNDDGRFLLRGLPASEQLWRIRMLGYATWEERTRVADLDMLTIGLLPQPVKLERIRVTARRLEERRRLAPVTVKAIEREELVRVGASDALTAARWRSPYLPVPCDTALPWKLCLRYRGNVVKPAVFLDDRRVPEEMLFGVQPAELYAIEFYGGPVRPQIRAYTIDFVEKGKRLRPLMFRGIKGGW